MGADYSGAYGLGIDPVVAATLDIDEINQVTSQLAGAKERREAQQAMRDAEAQMAREAAERQRLADMEAAAAAARANQPDEFWTNVAETYVDAVDSWVDYGKDGAEYVAEAAVEMPVNIIEATGEAGATIVESTAAPLEALETPLTSIGTAGVAVAAVAALFLLRKR